MRLPMALKRLLRPLVPDRIMARYRLAQHSRQVRVNVDLYVADRRAQRRWLAVTPDTYRVGNGPDGPPVAHLRLAPGDPVPHGSGRIVVSYGEGEEVELAARLLGRAGAGAGVVAESPRPRLTGRARVEPPLSPQAIAVAPATLAEVGGVPAGPQPLLGLLHRVRDAGHKLAVAPVVVPGLDVPDRADTIEGPAVVILAGVPMHDVGGGSRGAQMARELLRRGYHVTYVALYGTAETVDLGLRYVHPRLEQWRAVEFDVSAWYRRIRGERPLALVEIPAPDLLPATLRLRDGGFRVVYDLIDDWTAPSLGGEWYRPDVEERFVAAADAVVASASDLVARLEVSGRAVALVPNGVDETLFGGDPGPRPPDFPPGDGPVIGYHGSLYGDWFDWDALAAVAAAYPAARVIVIGDTKVAHPALPENVTLLGLKPQTALPAYLGRLDVGIIPFAVSDVTHAVSPLKAFEYLASGVPVAAPPLRALEGIDGIHTAARLTDAVAAALAAPRPDRAAALAAHSWGARLGTLFAAAGLDLAPVVDAGARVVLRPTVHYDREQRRL
jgi:glycosyltransferase involved in cell wall biosynthesis